MKFKFLQNLWRSPFFVGAIVGCFILLAAHYLITALTRDHFTDGYKQGQIDYAAGKRCVKLEKTQRGEIVYILLDSCEFDTLPQALKNKKIYVKNN